MAHNPKARLTINQIAISELLAARECYLKVDNDFCREQVARIAQDIAELERDNADLVAELAAGELGTKPLHFK